MLKTLRKSTKAVVWTVVVSFILWGGISTGLQMTQQGPTVGKVFGKSVSQQDFLRHQEAEKIFNPNFQFLQEPELIRLAIWRRIALVKEAKKRKIKVADDEVRENIIRLLGPKNAEFDKEQYKKWVRTNTRLKPREFEEQLREQIRIQKLNQEVFESITDAEEASESDVLKRFLYIYGRYQFQIYQFETQEEAENFKNSFDSSQLIETAIQAQTPLEIQSTGSATLQEHITQWPSLFMAFDLQEIIIERNLSQPVLFKDLYTLFYVEKLERPDRSQLTTEKREFYAEQITNSRKQQRAFEIIRGIASQAQIEDYGSA